ncbi:MAG: hypothetical protein LKM43_05005 [Wolbachia endosymbiont of Penenirmus auritus]|nr:hypothetical protein [Wolbachia endosymbiont of Penenirmus auritus]
MDFITGKSKAIGKCKLELKKIWNKRRDRELVWQKQGCENRSLKLLQKS